MSKRWFYQEELFFAQENNSLREINQDKIIDMLNRNGAVGVVAGFYEEGFPIYFISSFALNNIGMTFEQFMNVTGGKYLEAVCDEDRAAFIKSFIKGENSSEYRLKNSAGEGLWVQEERTQSEACDGRKIWISAVRLTDEVRRISQLNREAFQMLQDSYFRISTVDLNRNFITDMKVVESEVMEMGRLQGDYRKTIELCANNHVKEGDREDFVNVLSVENLKSVFLGGGKSVYFNYHRLVDGEWKWVRSQIVPVENFCETNARVMWYVRNISEEKAKEAEMTDKLLKSNAELIQAKQELEEANRRINESNIALRRTLSVEEQYRHAIISEAVFVYNVNVSKNLIEQDFFEIRDGQMTSVLPLVGLQAPCEADDFFYRWSKEMVFPEDRELFIQTINTRNLLEAYERGETELIVEVESAGFDDTPQILRHTILLTKDTESGDILALSNAKDITDTRRKERDARRALLDAYEAADRASSAKTDFLSKMSHDIRTPLNAIIGMTAIAGTRLNDPEGVAECLGKISSASKHLLSLVNEVLDMSRIESGTMSFNEEDFNLFDMVDNLVKMTASEAETKRQKVDITTHNLPHENVTADMMGIQQALVCILTNAIRYTPEEGDISIAVTEKPSPQSHTGRYEFVFQDNGIGMSEEFLERIFEPFERAEDVRINKIHGTGLGLTISRNIIQMMGGDIEIESEQGIGTIVTVTIPLKYLDKDQADGLNLEGRTVLVVDDSRFICESTCILLQNLGMKGEWVLSGEEAVARVIEKKHKGEELFAILLDWSMPGMGGLETAKAIRRQAQSEVPIAVVSSFDWVNIEMEARVAGIDGYIMKPLYKNRLLNTFKGFLPKENVEEHNNSLEEIGKRDYSDKRLLVVEDNDLNREIATEILSMTGVKIETAENGKEAVDMMLASAPGYYDLILMDIQMPVMNGYDATCAIRALEREDAKKIPIVAMTANAFLEDVQKAKASGMNEHMMKPLDIEQLQNMLARWLG